MIETTKDGSGWVFHTEKSGSVGGLFYDGGPPGRYQATFPDNRGCNPESASVRSNEKDPRMVQEKHRSICSITEKRNPESGKKFRIKLGSNLRQSLV
jgi:hypothetical protein